MKMVLALLAALLAGGPDFLTLKKDTTWTYDVKTTRPDQDGRMTDTMSELTSVVKKTEDGKLWMDNSGRVLVWYTDKDGGLCFGFETEEGFEPAVVVIKGGSKTGDSWKPLLQDAPIESEAMNMGTETIEVLGAKMEVTKITMKFVSPFRESKTTYFINNKMGVVRMEVSSGPAKAVVTLKKFVEGK